MVDSMERDDGGWNVTQVKAWVIRRDLVEVKKYKNDQDLFDLANLYNLNGQDSPERPVRTKAETDDNWNIRMENYHFECIAHDEKLEETLKNAVDEILQHLLSGKLVALDKHGRKVSKDWWQTNGLNDARYKPLFIRSKDAKKLWPANIHQLPANAVPHISSKPSQRSVNEWTLNQFQLARAEDRKSPKRETIIAAGREELGASTDQMRAAINTVPDELRGTQGRRKATNLKTKQKSCK